MKVPKLCYYFESAICKKNKTNQPNFQYKNDKANHNTNP